MSQEREWMTFTDKWGRRSGLEPGVRLDRNNIYIDKSLYDALGTPRQVYYSYCRSPLAIAIHPILKPADMPGERAKVYSCSHGGVSVGLLLSFLDLKIKGPIRLPARVEDGVLIVDLENVRAEAE